MIDVTPVTDANFDREVLQAHGPVVVEFWTHGCKPCRRLGKIIRGFAAKMKIATCNVDDEPALGNRLGVMNVPTLLFFKHGELIDRAIGTVNEVSEDEVAQICDRLVP